MSSQDTPIATNTPSGAPPSPVLGSPMNRVKFSCSHGGKILPRPIDSQLKYVGGETRVISVPRDISLKELKEKLSYLTLGEMVLKYQVASEDLDTLVSVKSDEDVNHMLNEIDNHERTGSPKVRAFLFPANPVLLENQNASDHEPEQKYIDAINGIVRTTPSSAMKQYPVMNVHESFVSSTCSTPISSYNCTTETMTNEALLQSIQLHLQRIHNCSHLPGYSQTNRLPNPSPHCQLPIPSQGRGNGTWTSNEPLHNASQVLNGASTGPDHLARSAPSSTTFIIPENRLSMRSAPSSPSIYQVGV